MICNNCLNEPQIETLEYRRTLLCINFYSKIQTQNDVIHGILCVTNPLIV